MTFAPPPSTGAYVLPTNVGGTTCLGRGDPTKRGDHCEILSAPRDIPGVCTTGHTKGATLVGWSTRVVHMLRKCPCNFVNALNQRHGAKRREPERFLADDVLPQWAAIFRTLVGPYAACEYRDDDTWLATRPAGKRKAILHSRAHDDVLPNKIKAFVKSEVATSAKKARLIQAYINDATMSFMGPQFYSLQKVACAEFNRREVSPGIDVTFSSGMNATGISAWMKAVVADGATAFYERDGANWDSTMGPWAAHFRHELYDLIDSELRKFAEAGDCIKGFGAFKAGLVRYLMEYGVKSGHYDTTLGNSIINAAIAHAVMLRLGLKGSIIVAGDDLVIAMRSDFDLDEFMRCERQYGIEPEAGKFFSPAHVTYCSGIFVGEDCLYVPTPGRLFQRLWWAVRPPAALEAYKRGVAKGLLPACHDLPVLRIFLSKFDTDGIVGRSDKGYQFIGVDQDLGGVDYLSFSRRYGISEHDLRECEAWLEQLPNTPLLLVHPVLDRIVEVDTVDITQRAAMWPRLG